VALESVLLGGFALTLLSLGYVLTFRVETALAFQRRYAEALSSVPPSENPEYYERTYEHRRGVFRLGGTVFLLVGTAVLSVTVYGTFFVDSFA
jgi:hypothetical protein